MDKEQIKDYLSCAGYSDEEINSCIHCAKPHTRINKLRLKQLDKVHEEQNKLCVLDDLCFSLKKEQELSKNRKEG